MFELYAGTVCLVWKQLLKKLLEYAITDSCRIPTPKPTASLVFGFYKCNREIANLDSPTAN